MGLVVVNLSVSYCSGINVEEMPNKHRDNVKNAGKTQGILSGLVCGNPDITAMIR